MGGSRNSVKGLVLAGVFVECYLIGRKLVVYELLAADPLLNSHYGNKSHVLSNVLRRYTKLGLLDREEDFVTGHPYRYGLTEKGFNRLGWMYHNSARYLFYGIDLLRPLGPAFVFILEKRKLELDSKRLRSLQQELHTRGRVTDSVKVGISVQEKEFSLKINYSEAKLFEILQHLREKRKVQWQELRTHMRQLR